MKLAKLPDPVKQLAGVIEDANLRFEADAYQREQREKAKELFFEYSSELFWLLIKQLKALGMRGGRVLCDNNAVKLSTTCRRHTVVFRYDNARSPYEITYNCTRILSLSAGGAWEIMTHGGTLCVYSVDTAKPVDQKFGLFQDILRELARHMASTDFTADKK